MLADLIPIKILNTLLGFDLRNLIIIKPIFSDPFLGLSKPIIDIGNDERADA
jgi:hypothetical protein